MLLPEVVGRPVLLLLDELDPVPELPELAVVEARLVLPPAELLADALLVPPELELAALVEALGAPPVVLEAARIAEPPQFTDQRAATTRVPTQARLNT